MSEEPEPIPGSGIVWSTLVGTAAFVVLAVAAVVAPAAVPTFVTFSLVMFALGTLTFFVAFLRAVERSRVDAIGMGGLYFLAGSTAPSRVQMLMLGAFAVQVVVSFAAAGVRVYTPVAFGLLVPMFGLGMMGMWGATYGHFESRRPGRPPPPSPDSEPPPTPTSD